MDVKPGYKQTEVGDLPSDWGVVLLDSVAKRGSGHTPDKAYPEYWDGTIKWISLQDTQRLDRLYIHDTTAKITPAGIANSSARMHPRGTVVMSRDAGVGKSAIMTDDMAVSQHFMAWTCGSSLNNHYLYYWLQSNKAEFERIAMGNTIKTIGLPYFRQLVIPLPARAEQDAIAAALSDADALIESLEQFIAKKRAVKQGAMQELLTGKRRLPGFECKPGYEQTRAGVIPSDWHAAAIGDHFSFKNGLNKGKEYFGYGTPIINYMDVYRHDGIRASDILGRVDVGRQEIDSFGVKRGDVFFTRTSETPEEVGIASVLLENSPSTVFSGFVLRGRPRGDTLADQFKKYCFSSDTVRSQIIANSTYTTRALTNGRVLSAVAVPLPPTKTEQEAIAAVLSDMDAEIDALEQKLLKVRQVKQGMMQELLTGRIRLVSEP